MLVCQRFSLCVRVCVCSFYNLQSPRTSVMTECKYSHTVFYPKMASALSGTNIMCVKKNHIFFGGSGIEKSLFRCQIMFQVALPLLETRERRFVSHVSTCVFRSVCTVFHPASASADDIRARTGWHLADQTATGGHKRRSVHCPVSQLVNVSGRMWQLWDR